MSESGGRERWFFVQGMRRRGPLAREELVQALRSEAGGRSILVWRKGLADWTPAESLPEIASRLAPVVENPEGAPTLPAAETPGPRPPAARGKAHRGLRVLLPVGSVLVFLAASFYFFTRPPHSEVVVPSGALPPDAHRGAREPLVPAGTVSPSLAPPSGPAGGRALRAEPPVASVTESEADLPSRELRQLRSVASWSGRVLRLTVVNGTAWRVTEIHARIERFTGEAFAADADALTFLPPPEPVDAGVADLLRRVAPDRRKAGLNPFDTGIFESEAGPAPEGFRWEIESARGYPPPR